MVGKNLAVWYLNRTGVLVVMLVIGAWHAGCQNNQKAPDHILALGDSNGAAKDGWVVQLKKRMPKDSIYNLSISGNTLGFDNLDNPKLNTLHNLNRYLERALSHTGHLDQVIILLGTNDSKAVFDGREQEVLQNLKSVITGIREYPYEQSEVPEILVVSPPPYGPDSLLAEKYRGGAKRVAYLAKEYKKVAEEMNCNFVDIHSQLKKDFENRSKDGVHLDSVGQGIIARNIAEKLKN